MIVRETEGCLKLFKQHDHAKLSYEISKWWKLDNFPCPEWKEAVLYAIKNHDRAWIPLDLKLKWNPAKNEPFNFVDYPLAEKLQAYTKGIEEVERKTTYGAILCSLHYTSFFTNEQSEQIEMIKQFKRKEKERRKRLSSELRLDENASVVHQHLQILQFCDDLSLYVCMNKQGATKQEEFAWFKEGFRQRFSFAPKGLKARWLDKQHIKVVPFPFTKPFTATLPVYHLNKGTSDAKSFWDQTKERIIVITFVP